MKKIGIILPPEFRRLGPHVGGLYRWFKASQAGLLPKPHGIFGVSAGAIAGASCLPWTEKNFAKVASLIKDLKTKQIFTLPRDVEAEILLFVVPYLLFFLNVENWSKTKKLIFHVAELASSLALTTFLFRRFLKRPSVFSNSPLYELLKINNDSRFDFKSIFNSDIRFEAIATDMETGGETVFCNHDPRDQDPERFVKAILASSRLSGRFPPVVLDGKTLGDGGILGHAPIHRAIAAGCDAIVIFLFTSLKESRPLPKNFMEDMVIAAHFTEMLATRLSIDSYRKQLNDGAQLPALHIVEAGEPLEELTFKNFTSEALVNSMNLGYRAVDKDLAIIQRLVT